MFKSIFDYKFLLVTLFMCNRVCASPSFLVIKCSVVLGSDATLAYQWSTCTHSTVMRWSHTSLTDIRSHVPLLLPSAQWELTRCLNRNAAQTELVWTYFLGLRDSNSEPLRNISNIMPSYGLAMVATQANNSVYTNILCACDWLCFRQYVVEKRRVLNRAVAFLYA